MFKRPCWPHSWVDMTETLKHTPLHAVHVSLGAKMVPFAGFEMPVTYPGGIGAEHRAVREAVGIFDVSHMGEFEVSGPDRNAFVQRVTCNDVGALKPGQAQYSAILTDRGTFVDDCLVYRFDDRLMLVVNAANRAADGEQLWHALAGSGRAEPCGLAARDTLRLEAGLPLYGNDIDDTVTPYEAGLSFIVKLDKGAPFTGEAALKKQKLEGVTRRLVGFTVSEPKVVGRHGMDVYVDGKQVDIVRSGTVTPTVNAAIGTTYVPKAQAQAGTQLEIDVRGKRVPAQVVKLPFVAHRTKR